MVLELVPYAFFWSHRVFWQTQSSFLCCDDVHLNGGGNINYIAVYEGQCSNACVYWMIFSYQLSISAVHHFRDSF